MLAQGSASLPRAGSSMPFVATQNVDCACAAPEASSIPAISARAITGSILAVHRHLAQLAAVVRSALRLAVDQDLDLVAVRAQQGDDVHGAAVAGGEVVLAELLRREVATVGLAF